MAEKESSTWAKGCGCGCIVLVLVGVALLGAGGWWMRGATQGFDDSITAQERLDSDHGTPDQFVPWPHGGIPEDWVEAFVGVQRALRGPCEAIEATWQDVQGLDGAAGGGEAPPAKDVFRSIQSALSLAPRMGEYYRARDQALIAADMGHGEYSWLWVLAFRSGPEKEGDRQGNRRVIGRTRRVFLGQLERLVESGRQLGVEEDVVAELALELDELTRDEGRRPFQDGLTWLLASALDPYRDELDGLVCDADAIDELGRFKRDGMSIRSSE